MSKDHVAVQGQVVGMRVAKKISHACVGHDASSLGAPLLVMQKSGERRTGDGLRNLNSSNLSQEVMRARSSAGRAGSAAGACLR